MHTIWRNIENKKRKKIDEPTSSGGSIQGKPDGLSRGRVAAAGLGSGRAVAAAVARPLRAAAGGRRWAAASKGRNDDGSAEGRRRGQKQQRAEGSRIRVAASGAAPGGDA
jgi:hypothetical protein